VTAVLTGPDGSSGAPAPRRLIEILVRLCLLREAFLPFAGCTTTSDVVNVVLGLSELQLVGLVLCLYIPGTAVWEICKRRRAPVAYHARS
jgi:hypothetical protein